MINLSLLRENANIPINEMAALLGCCESEITCYEADPKVAPFEVVYKWVQLCGTDLESAMFASAHQSHVIDPGKPYEELNRQFSLLIDYVQGTYPASADLDIPAVPAKAETLTRIASIWRKPNIVLTGPFDAGKSRLANALLSTRQLPSRYTPTTQVATHIRHTSDRPQWQKEDVLILDAQRCEQFWNDTEKGFTEASQAVETEYGEYLDQLRKQMTTDSRSTLEHSLAKTEELRSFFDGLPWSCPG